MRHDKIFFNEKWNLQFPTYRKYKTYEGYMISLTGKDASIA